VSNVTRAAKAADLCAQLSEGAWDVDAAIHWSHFNGVFSAILSMANNGIQVDEILSEYEVVFKEWGVEEWEDAK